MDNLQILSPELHIFSGDTFPQWSLWFLKTEELVFFQQPKDETDNLQMLSLRLCICSADTFSQGSTWFLKMKVSVFHHLSKDHMDSLYLPSSVLTVFSVDTFHQNSLLETIIFLQICLYCNLGLSRCFARQTDSLFLCITL